MHTFLFVQCLGVGLFRMGVPSFILALVAVAFVIIGGDGQQAGLLLFTNFCGEFFAGIGVYLYLSVRGKYQKLLIAASILVLGMLGGSWRAEYSPTGSLAIACLFALFLCFIYPFDARLAELRCLGVFSWLGKISFSLYLTHTFLGLKFVNLAARWVSDESFWLLPVQLIAYSLSISLAYVFYLGVESQLERFRLNRKLRLKAFTSV